METRAEQLLKAIVELYIKDAHAIGSQVLAQDKNFAVSPATIRNEMMMLENEGYIYQPHTSAGRIPTIKGYQYYLDNLLSIKSCSQTELAELKNIQQQDTRDLAKLLVNKTNLASLVAFAPNNLYFTGLFNLFSQPEFEDYKMVLSMSQVVDSLEKAINSIYYDIDKAKVLLGDDNPFSQYCSVVIAPLPGAQRELLGILGPVRMDYNRILGLFDALIK